MSHDSDYTKQTCCEIPTPAFCLRDRRSAVQPTSQPNLQRAVVRLAMFELGYFILGRGNLALRISGQQILRTLAVKEPSVTIGNRFMRGRSSAG